MKNVLVVFVLLSLVMFACSSGPSSGNAGANSTVPVTGISLDLSTLSMNVLDRRTLTATVKPDNATKKDITWESSNNLIATVFNGGVLGISPGPVEITATTADGNYSAKCKVTVN